jgi:hypothetical protein
MGRRRRLAPWPALSVAANNGQSEGVSMATERAIHVDTREDLIYLLAEAAEIEHNLMCCYLFAAFRVQGECRRAVDRS